MQSIFRLAGNDEDALTFALGFLLAYDSDFCSKLIRRCGIASTKQLRSGYSIHLQEVTDISFGRRDIVIEAKGTRVVLEAKVGGAEPTADQLIKYGKEESLWNKSVTRAVVALTQVELPTTTFEYVDSVLSKLGIRFYNVRWHQVVELVLDHKPPNDARVLRYLLDEFISFVRGDYHMGYYDAEILIQDPNPLNATIFKEGWMYVSSLRDKKAPLYFALYFTRRGSKSGISMISRVRNSKTLRLVDADDVAEAPTNEHLKRWRKGLSMLRERAKDEGFLRFETRLFFGNYIVNFARLGTHGTSRPVFDNHSPTEYADPYWLSDEPNEGGCPLACHGA